MRLGEFEILELAGSGAMGDVWCGEHPDGTQVAIKVLRGARNDEQRLQFSREIRAVAALRHPGIVQILDTGKVPANVDHAEIDANSTWFAMEFAEQGTLPALQSWSEVARFLLDVLDALAHAHARGVIHRDLKPANILVAKRGAALRPIVTDFGIAQITDQSVLGEKPTPSVEVVGTPQYMAPEQFHSDWRAYGPWTDLYALGCMTYEVVCGEPPFQASSAFALALEHLNTPFPALASDISFPPAFESWLLRLVQKNPKDRFRCAADAAWNLTLLIGDNPHWQPASGMSVNGNSSPPLPTSIGPTTLNFGETQVLRGTPTLSEIPLPSTAALKVELPPLPQHYTQPQAPPATVLRNVGAALFGIRKNRFVDREESRGRIWEALGKVTRDKSPQTVVIRGPEGVGKTEVVRWVCGRAKEVGATLFMLSTSHSEIPSSQDGLPRIVERMAQVEGLSHDETYRAFRDLLLEHGSSEPIAETLAAELTQILQPAETSDEMPAVYFENATQRYRAAANALKILSKSRPVIVWVDDAQWGFDAVDFVAFATRTRLSVLFIVSGTDESPWPSRLEVPATLPLMPLPEADYRKFVQDLLPLDPHSIDFLIERTSGDPQLAKSLVGHWVDTEGLTPHAKGYQIAAKARTTAEIERIWAILLRKFLQDFQDPSVVFRALAIITAFGREVDLTEWQSACRCAQISPPIELIDELEANGHAERRGVVLMLLRMPFFHEVQFQAKASGLWKEAHQSCADAALRNTENGVPVEERVAAHLVQAGDLSGAVSSYLKAIALLMQQSSYERALTVTNQALDLVPDDGSPNAWVRLRTYRIEALRYKGRLDEAKSAALELGQSISGLEIGSAELAHYRRTVGGLLYITGQADMALDYYQKAAQLFSQIDDHQGLAKVWHAMGWFALNQGHFDRAAANYRKSAKFAGWAPVLLDRAWALQGLADTLFRAGKDGSSNAIDALNIAESLGAKSCAGMCLKSLGDQSAREGDYAQASLHYESAKLAFEAVESSLIGLIDTRMAVLFLKKGEQVLGYEKARATVETNAGKLAIQFLLIPRLVLLEAAIRSGEGVDAALAAAEEIAEKAHFVHPDIPWLMERLLNLDVAPELSDRLRSLQDVLER